MSTSTNTTSLEGSTVALIAAAVSLAVHGQHRIVSIHESSKENTLQLEVPVFILNPWSMEGRSQHFGSHKVR